MLPVRQLDAAHILTRNEALGKSSSDKCPANTPITQSLKGLSHEIFYSIFYFWTLNQYFLFTHWQSLKFLVDQKCVKTVVNIFGYFLQIGLQFSKISLNPLAIVFSGFSKAAGELQTGFLKLLWAAVGLSKPAWRVYIYLGFSNGFRKVGKKSRRRL
jgi:hypothetical protein